MAKITWTKAALSWLKDIHEYISLDNPGAADKVVSDIYEKAGLLKENPELGYQYSIYSEKNIRILLYGHYRVTYLYEPESEEIVVLGIFHGALDIDKYFDI